jgi:hypothetical protein
MKTFKEYLEEAKKGRCWTGYKPVPGKKPYSPGSCEKVKEDIEQVDEVAPPGFEGTVKAMKKHKEIDNPWALAWSMKNKGYKSHKKADGTQKNEEVELDETAAWQRKEGKSESGGLNQKGVESYRRENPGSKLKTAVTTKPSKLKPGSKAANRRKSFCARMSGMKKRLTSAATAKDPDSRINKSLRKWNC